MQPFEDRLGGNSQSIGRTLDRVSAIRPAGGIILNAIDLCCADTEALSQQVNVIALERNPSGGYEVLLVQILRYLSIEHPRHRELPDPFLQ